MVKQVAPEEAAELMKSNKLIIADVRDVGNYEEAHIENAVHLSMARLQEFCEEQDKDTPILIYCYHGVSSQSVAQHLETQGFNKVYSLIGGFEAWKQKNPVSKEE
ncbi:MAG: thiosulfate sulfurtransferase GlpE [Gammaproteobacteria bacterium]|nr:thiosulfate sulfurtransferase GlpE [Gammaproteobacteria bacterium]